MRRSDREDGFVMLEALVAFAVLSLVLVLFYEALAGNYRTAALTRERDLALAEARSHLQGLGLAMPIRAGGSSGVYHSGAFWKMEAAPLPPPERGDGMPPLPRYLVTLEVRNREGRQLTRLQTVVIDRRMRDE